MGGRYSDWRYSASLFLLTTPEGANLPASASENDFPLLVRLNSDTFDFRQAKPHGEDLRFSTADDIPLAYQIEVWDPAGGAAAIWVRIPHVVGNARQEVKLHWGNPEAVSESSGSAVFNAANGYVSVLHMDDSLTDEIGAVPPTNAGTSVVPGLVGKARHFAGGQGVFCGDKRLDLPYGAGAHSTEVWMRAERSNATIVGWGNEGGGRGSKVRMQFRSPPHIHIDSDFSDVNGTVAPPLSEWVQVVHTYANGQGRIYINGKLDASANPVLDIKRPSRFWVGGWYNNYDFMGDIDEVRISQVARSADWVRLEFENQKPLQTLVGSPVQTGHELSVSPAQVVVEEGRSATLSAQAGGAQKVYWTLVRDGKKTVVAVDRLHYAFDAGRVVGDKACTVQFNAVYPDGVKTREIPVTIKEDIPDPVFTLKAPSRWDGRKSFTLAPEIANLPQMQAKSAGKLNYTWSLSGIAAIQETTPGKLRLERAQNSGPLTVTLAVNNGGAEVVHSAMIQVTEPKKDAWAVRTSAPDEKPEENQFYARDDRNQGLLLYNGNLAKEKYGAATTAAETVFLNLYAEDRLVTTVRRKLAADRSYALSVPLKPGLVRYHIEFGVMEGKQEHVLRRVANLVCGDAYLIDGQSNAEAVAWGDAANPDTSDWVRSFGSPGGGSQEARLKLWGNAVGRAPGGKLQIGYWGMELAKRLVEAEQIPICILNGAVGGTRIDQHQRNPSDPEDGNTIYGRLLWRVEQAHLTHGIRGVLWHQGENDQGADGPGGKYGWEEYQSYFVAMAGAWKQNYPNIQHYYLFQIWPLSCAMGINGSDNRLREVQRKLPTLYSHMSIMSTLGIEPGGGCHYPPAGYTELAQLIFHLVERESYGKVFPQPVSPPDLKRATYTGTKQDEITLEFDQPVIWTDKLASQFLLDGVRGAVATGSVSGNLLTLKLTAPSTAKQITYLDSRSWSQDNLLRGKNGIAALTFCEVPIIASRKQSLSKLSLSKQPALHQASLQPASSGQSAAKQVSDLPSNIKDYGLKPYVRVSQTLPHVQDTPWKLTCALPYNCQFQPWIQAEGPSGQTLTFHSSNPLVLYLTPTETCTTLDGNHDYEAKHWVSGEGAVYTIPAGVKVKAVNHGWNPPVLLLSQDIAGVRPIEPGWATYEVMPKEAYLTSIKVVVPSIKGSVRMELRKTVTEYALKLTSPAETTAIVGIPKGAFSALKSITVKGQRVWDGAYHGGIPGLSWVGDDGAYVKFRVAPGVWSFVGHGALPLDKSRVPLPIPRPETALDRRGWTASASTPDGSFLFSGAKIPIEVPAANAIDGDAWTGWRDMTATQYPGQWFQIDMMRPQSFDKIVLDNTWALWDSPQQYEGTISDDGTHWSAPIATGEGNLGITPIHFLPQTARWVRITQTGVSPTYHWSIYELNLYRSAL